MDNNILNVLVSIGIIAVLAALVWLVVEVVATLRKTRQTMDDLHKRIDPTLESVERITAALEPAVAKVDPLVERVSLTVDAANLEMMRVDQILEDVSQITDSVTSAADAVDAAANAPMELVNAITGKVRTAIKGRSASEESVALGEAKSEQVPAPEGASLKSTISATVKVAQEAIDAVRDGVRPTEGQPVEPAQAEAAEEPTAAEESVKYYTYDVSAGQER